ncbi:MAG: hypothetical protein WCW31_00880 [Patescibacteria group bacterium]|jgi:hypothetical protein
MLTERGKHILSSITSYEARVERERNEKLVQDAKEWAQTRVTCFAKEIENGCPRGVLLILNLEQQKPNKNELMRITALNAALGIDIMQGAQIETPSYDPDKSKLSSVTILVSELKKLLEAASPTE